LQKTTKNEKVIQKFARAPLDYHTRQKTFLLIIKHDGIHFTRDTHNTSTSFSFIMQAQNMTRLKQLIKDYSVYSLTTFPTGTKAAYRQKKNRQTRPKKAKDQRKMKSL